MLGMLKTGLVPPFSAIHTFSRSVPGLRDALSTNRSGMVFGGGGERTRMLLGMEVQQ